MRQVTHALLTRPPLSHKNRHSEEIQFKRFARLACVRHAASVHPEPGSNSRKKFSLGPGKLLAFPIPLLTVFGRHLSMPFSELFFSKRIFRVVVYYLVIKVLRVSLFSTAILDYHIFKRFVNSFFYFFLLSVFRSFVSAALTCDSCDRISCCKLNVNAFFSTFLIFFFITAFSDVWETF